MTMNRKDRNQFIIDEFEEGASINDIAANPRVSVQYGAVRRIIINSMGYQKYKQILRGRRKVKPVTDKQEEQRKPKPDLTFFKWLLGAIKNG